MNSSNDNVFSTNYLKGIRLAILLISAFILILISYIVFKPINGLNGTKDGLIAKLYGFTLLFIIFLVGLFFKFKNKLKYDNVVLLIILIGLVLQMTYMLYTGGHTRQYDTWSSNNNAHYDYALSFYLTGKLPNHHIDINSIYQFYHPPLNAFVQGMFMHIFEFICPVQSLRDSTEQLFSSCQILSCFYMFGGVLFFDKIVNGSNLSKQSKIIAITFISCFPRVLQLSGQLNNDAITVFLSSIGLLFFTRWTFKSKSMLNIGLTALFIGLAMMAKLSESIICLGIGLSFILEFFKSLLKKGNSIKISRITIHYLVFLSICAPLGLWFQFYSHFVYDLPFNFVFSNLNSMLFTGTQDWVVAHKPNLLDYYDKNNLAMGEVYTSGLYNALIRYVSPFYIHDFKQGLYCNTFDNYNILTFAIRSAIFGEFRYSTYLHGDIYAYTSIIFGFILWFLFIFGLVFIFVIRKKVKFGDDGNVAIYIFGGIILMYIYLQISMPYGCSMDFRYIVPIILPIGYLIGKINDNLVFLKKEHISKPKYIFTNIYRYSLLTVLIVFILSASLFYLLAI